MWAEISDVYKVRVAICQGDILKEIKLFKTRNDEKYKSISNRFSFVSRDLGTSA